MSMGVEPDSLALRQIVFESRLPPVENLQAGGTAFDEDSYVQLPEFLEMVVDIFNSDWYFEEFENIPEMKVYVLKDQATAWFIEQGAHEWHEEAARDMAHD